MHLFHNSHSINEKFNLFFIHLKYPRKRDLSPADFQYRYTKTISLAKCERKLQAQALHTFTNDKYTICTNGDSDRGRDYYKSFGSPLISKSNKLLGISLLISANIENEGKHGPNIYTAIYPYKKWIKSILNEKFK